MSGNATNVTATCVDPVITTTTWVLLGLFLALAFFSKILTIMLFKGISGALKSFKATSFDRAFRKLFKNPVAALLCLLFLHLAWQVAPWLCALLWLRALTSFIILCLALLFVLILIARMFEFGEIFLRFFNFDKVYVTPFREGIRVAKLATLFFVGILFFSFIVLALDSTTEFRVSLFFSGVNVISMGYILFFVPVVRDALGGVQLISERTFSLGDWVEVDGIKGTVERIGLFVVVLRTLQGRMTMLTNSRFVESYYIVYPLSRRRVVVLRFPLPANCKSGAADSDASIRSLLVQVESALQSTDEASQLYLSDVYVNVVSRTSLEGGEDQIEVRYVTDHLNSVEAQANRMKDLISLIAQRIGGTMEGPQQEAKLKLQ